MVWPGSCLRVTGVMDQECGCLHRHARVHDRWVELLANGVEDIAVWDCLPRQLGERGIGLASAKCPPLSKGVCSRRREVADTTSAKERGRIQYIPSRRPHLSFAASARRGLAAGAGWGRWRDRR